MGRYEKAEKYNPDVENNLKFKKMEELIGHDEIDQKYLGKCSNFYYEYDECVRDALGETVYCDHFREALQKCEEETGMYEDVLKALNIVPDSKSFLKYTNLYQKPNV